MKICKSLVLLKAIEGWLEENNGFVKQPQLTIFGYLQKVIGRENVSSHASSSAKNFLFFSNSEYRYHAIVFIASFLI